ncbi:MAG: hypothetical protein ACREQW_10640 [Candidatus Binatia bacterium]
MAADSLKRIGFLTLLAVLILILALVNVLLTLGNQSVRVQLAERQQSMNQSIQMEGLDREIVGALASVAVKNNDAELKGLLASQDINVSGDSKAAGGAK